MRWGCSRDTTGPTAAAAAVVPHGQIKAVHWVVGQGSPECSDFLGHKECLPSRGTGTDYHPGVDLMRGGGGGRERDCWGGAFVEGDTSPSRGGGAHQIARLCTFACIPPWARWLQGCWTPPSSIHNDQHTPPLHHPLCTSWRCCKSGVWTPQDGRHKPVACPGLAKYLISSQAQAASLLQVSKRKHA